MAVQRAHRLAKGHETKGASGSGAWMGVAGILVAALLVLAGWWLFSRQQPERLYGTGAVTSTERGAQPSTVTQTPTPTADTPRTPATQSFVLPAPVTLTNPKTYRSSQTNFTFVYPASWQLQEENNGNFVLTDPTATSTRPHAFRYIRSVQNVASGTFRDIGKGEFVTTNSGAYALVLYQPTTANMTMERDQRLLVIANPQIPGSFFYTYHQEMHPQALAEARVILESLQVTR